MPVFTKLIIFVILNIAGLSGLILRLLKANVSPLGALMLAWRIVVNGHRNHDLRGLVYPDGASILHKTWWLMSGLIILFWIVEPGKAYGYLTGLLLGLHLLWYLLGQFNAHFGADRVFELNPQWGMVYLAVRPDSVLNARTLSELDLRKKNLLVLAIERQRQIIPFPKGLETLMPGDHLVMFGDLNYYRGLES